MVIQEEIEFERSISDRESHIALPIEIEYDFNTGEKIITVYSFCLDTAEEFEKSFACDMFSESAVEYLEKRIAPLMKKFDFRDGVHKIYFEYGIEKEDKSKILPECELIDSLEGETWGDISLDEFELDPDDNFDRMAVVRQDGKIVAYAGINDISPDESFEITVECDGLYRKRGYAASCLSLLAGYLISHGKRVTYICDEKNTASQKTAESVGFILYKKYLPYVFYRSEDAAETEEKEKNEEIINGL